MSALAGKTALVTGGAGGIGAACARELAAAGAHVTVADLDEAGTAEIAAEIGGTAWTVDLLDVAALQDLVLHTDILVNNAGVQRVAPITGADAMTRPSAPIASARCGRRSVGTMALIEARAPAADMTLDGAAMSARTAYDTATRRLANA